MIAIIAKIAKIAKVAKVAKMAKVAKLAKTAKIAQIAIAAVRACKIKITDYVYLQHYFYGGAIAERRFRSVVSQRRARKDGQS